jgi:DNA-binding beta-propeller fold protein YncE
MQAGKLTIAFSVLAASVLCAGCQTSGAETTSADAPAMHIKARFPGPDGSWDFSTIDSAHRRIYVSRSNGVTALDLASGQVTPLLVAGSRTHIALPVNDGADILVTDGGSGGAFIADAHTGAIRVPTIATGTKPDAAFVEPTTGLAWVLDNHDGGVALIDTHAGRLVGRIAVAGALESPVSDGRGKVYITVEDHSEIVVIDVHARAVSAHYPLAGCEEPTGLAYDARDERLVAECANGAAKIVSARDGRILGTVAIGPRPDGLIVDARRNLIFAPTGGDAHMAIIDPARMAVVGAVDTRLGARSGALDPQTGHIYLPSGEFTPPATPGGRPTLVPGSFQILEIGSR